MSNRLCHTSPMKRKSTASLWTYERVDTLVIALWPLVKEHNWTYRDLMNVIRPALNRPRSSLSSIPYPCGREQDFAAYYQPPTRS